MARSSADMHACSFSQWLSVRGMSLHGCPMLRDVHLAPLHTDYQLHVFAVVTNRLSRMQCVPAVSTLGQPRPACALSPTRCVDLRWTALARFGLFDRQCEVTTCVQEFVRNAWPKSNHAAVCNHMHLHQCDSPRGGTHFEWPPRALQLHHRSTC